MAALFAVGLPFTYNGTTNHFATSTGGTATVAAVTSADTVTVDSLSGNATLTIGAAWSCTALTINNASATVACDATHGITASGAITLTAGTLNTNGQACSWGSLSSNNANSRTLTMGASAITVTGTGTAWNVSSTLTISVNTATATLSGAGVQFTNGNIDYKGMSVVFNGSGTATWFGSSATVANFTRTGTAIKTDSLLLNASGGVNVTGVCTLTGNSVINRLSVVVSSTGTQSAIKLGTTGTATVSNADFMDIAFTGTNTPVTGTSLGDCLNNAGITLDTPVTQTATGTASFTWSTHGWTTRVPLPQDNVVVNNAFIAGRTITADMPRMGADVTFSCSGNPILSLGVATSIFGSLTMASGMTCPNNTRISLAGRGTHTLTSAGIAWGGPFTFGNPGSTYTLQDSFTATTTTSFININFGTFATNNNPIACKGLNLNAGVATAVFSFGSSTITLSGTGTVWAASATNTINPDTSTIIISDTSVTGKTFAGGGLAYNKLQINGAASAAAVTTTGANTFNNITGQANAHLTLPSSTTTIISSLTSLGTAGNLFVLDASTGGVAATLSSTNIIGTNFLSVKDSTASGCIPFYAGVNGTLVSGDTNWSAITNPNPTNSGTVLSLLGVG